MAGRLDFIIETNSDAAVQSLQRYSAAQQDIINQAFVFNEKFRGGAMTVAPAAGGAMKTFGQETKTATTLARSLGQVMQTVGFTYAPQLTSQISLVTHSLKTLSEAGKLAKFNLAGLSVPVAIGLAGAAGWWQVGKQLTVDQPAEEALGQQLQAQRKKLQDLILDLNLRGKLSDKEAIQLQVQLLLDNHNLETVYNDVRKVRAKLREIVGPAVDLKAVGEIGQMEMELKAKTKEGKARALAELDIEASGLQAKMMALYKAAGMEWTGSTPEIDAYTKKRFADIQKEFAPKNERLPSPLTNLERLGFVFNSGGSFASDYGRQTADHTRRTAKATETIAQKIDKLGGTAPDFSNQ